MSGKSRRHRKTSYAYDNFAVLNMWPQDIFNSTMRQEGERSKRKVSEGIKASSLNNSNRKCGKLGKLKCSPFSPYSLPFTLVLLYFLFRGCILYALSMHSCCRY